MKNQKIICTLCHITSNHNNIVNVTLLSPAPGLLLSGLLRLLDLLQLPLDWGLAGRPPLLAAEVAHVLQVGLGLIGSLLGSRPSSRPREKPV